MNLSVRGRLPIRAASALSGSVTLLSEHFYGDPRYIAQCQSSLEYLPISSSWKSSLQSRLFTDFYLRVYQVDSPNIFIYNYLNGESRTFLVTGEGFLLEPYWQERWDRCLPFLSFTGHPGIESDIDLVVQIISSGRQNHIYMPFQANYTHFLFDSFAPAALAASFSNYWFHSQATLAFVGRPPSSWQQDFINCAGFSHYPVPGIDRLGLVRLQVDRIFVPSVSNYNLSFKYLRHLVRQASNHNGGYHKCSENKIIMLTRHDNRRSRILNALEVESLVRSMGGICVDPSSLTLYEKAQLFCDTRVYIAESSGCLNYALFSGPQSGLVSLVEPSLCVNQDFLDGGWAYTCTYASDRVRYVMGDESQNLPGSPVASARYSVALIKKAIIDLIAIC